MISLSSEESSSSDSLQDSTSKNLELCIEPIQPEKIILLQSSKDLVQHSEIASVADRLQLSDNSVTMFLAAVIKACNGIVYNFSLSRSTTRRKRIASRHKISLDILEKIYTLLLFSLQRKLAYMQYSMVKHCTSDYFKETKNSFKTKLQKYNFT